MPSEESENIKSDIEEIKENQLCLKPNEIIKMEQDDLIKSITKNKDKSVYDKAILQLKYDRLELKNNIIQISVIVVSTLITFIETIKASYEINEYIGVILPIILSSYIGLVIAIIRFLRYDEKRETISKLIERFSYIINKYKKKRTEFKMLGNEKIKLDDWNKRKDTFITETYEYLNQTREQFDNVITYSEKVYYKKKLKTIEIEKMFNDRDYENINHSKSLQHRKFVNKARGKRLNSILDYDKILDELDKNNEKEKEKEKYIGFIDD